MYSTLVALLGTLLNLNLYAKTAIDDTPTVQVYKDYFKVASSALSLRLHVLVRRSLTYRLQQAVFSLPYAAATSYSNYTSGSAYTVRPAGAPGSDC